MSEYSIDTSPMSSFLGLESNSRAESPIADAALIKPVHCARVGLPLGTFIKKIGMPVLKDIDTHFATSPAGCTGLVNTGLGSTFTTIKPYATSPEIVFRSILVPRSS